MEQKKPTVAQMKKKVKATGFDTIGFRPLGNQVALILSDEDLIVIGSPNAPADAPKPEKKSLISTAAGKPKIIKGPSLEKEEREKDKDNRTFTIGAVAIDLVDKLGSPQVGDEVSLSAGTLIEVTIDGHIYGVVPAHRLLAIHKNKIN